MHRLRDVVIVSARDEHDAKLSVELLTRPLRLLGIRAAYQTHLLQTRKHEQSAHPLQRAIRREAHIDVTQVRVLRRLFVGSAPCLRGVALQGTAASTGHRKEIGGFSITIRVSLRVPTRLAQRGVESRHQLRGAL